MHKMSFLKIGKAEEVFSLSGGTGIWLNVLHCLIIKLKYESVFTLLKKPSCKMFPVAV